MLMTKKQFSLTALVSEEVRIDRDTRLLGLVLSLTKTGTRRYQRFNMIYWNY
jgi:hypothetical protein